MATRPSSLLLPLTLRLSLYSLPPPCESTPQLDAQTRGVRFKGSLTSDRGFFSSVKQRVRFHPIRKVNSKARRRRCEENRKGGIKRWRWRKRWRKKESGGAKRKLHQLARRSRRSPPSTLARPPFSNYALPASSLFHEIQPCCPFASFQEPSPPSPPRFRRQPTRLTIARLPDPHDRMAKRMRESVDAADELPCVHRRRMRIYEILLPREGVHGWKSRNCGWDFSTRRIDEFGMKNLTFRRVECFFELPFVDNF